MYVCHDPPTGLGHRPGLDGTDWTTRPTDKENDGPKLIHHEKVSGASVTFSQHIMFWHLFFHIICRIDAIVRNLIL